MYLDEYAIPTTGAAGTLLQTLTLPAGACTLVPSTNTQGALTRAGDGRSVIFTCFAVAPGGALTAAQFATVTGLGSVSSFVSVNGIATPYYPASAAALNASYAYFTVAGGANGNTVRRWVCWGVSNTACCMQCA